MFFNIWQTFEYICIAAAAAKSLQSCPTLCDHRDGSPPGSAVPGILQARTLEWVAISFSNAWKWKVKVKSLSRLRLLAIPWTAAQQSPPSMGFSRQEYWSGVPSPSLPAKLLTTNCTIISILISKDSRITMWITSLSHDTKLTLRTKWTSKDSQKCIKITQFK